MEKMKQQVQQKLVANVIMDKCARSEYLIFRDAWCTQDRVLRFATPFFRKMFSVKENENGKWKTGDFVMYEVNNSVSSFVVNCVLSFASMTYDEIAKRDALLNALELKIPKKTEEIILKSWNLTTEDGNPNKLFENFDHLIEKELFRFEQDVEHILSESNVEQTEFHEGSVQYVTLNKYERNLKARTACLEAHGTACTVCGIDFGKTYGLEFEGKIEVHHIVPISQIGEDYVVDPINDLVPVCPNCHTALHSKKDGVYTVEELINLKEKQQKS